MVRIPRRWLALQQRSVGICGTCEKYNRQPTDSEVAEALRDFTMINWHGLIAMLDIPVQDAERGCHVSGKWFLIQYRSFQLAQRSDSPPTSFSSVRKEETHEIIKIYFIRLDAKQVANT